MKVWDDLWKLVGYLWDVECAGRSFTNGGGAIRVKKAKSLMLGDKGSLMSEVLN